MRNSGFQFRVLLVQGTNVHHHFHAVLRGPHLQSEINPGILRRLQLNAAAGYSLEAVGLRGYGVIPGL
ncbi:MAG: hypothetical protein ABSF14_08265 [Terriglobia bacterium]|jgi:hypothetical protein